MKCLRCSQEFIPPDERTNVCATCGDDLREEQDAYAAQMQAEGDDEVYARYLDEEANHEHR